MFKTKLAQPSVKRSGLVAAAIGLTVCLASTIALAATIFTATGIPAAVRVLGDNTEQLKIYMGGVDYFVYASNPPSDCPSRGADAFKEYQSIAQAALLSGKSITINYIKCADNGTSHLKFVQGIELVR